MPQMQWFDAFEKINPYIVKISTPRGSGSGFLFSARSKNIFGIATSAHVLDQSHAWEEPIRIDHKPSGKSILTHPDNRVVFLNERIDTAALVLFSPDISFPEEVLKLTPVGKSLKIGNEVGWVGYPALSSENLCLFSGRISCYLSAEEAYLVDGVAINGVSGGPAFFLPPTGGITIIGVVSAYIPNRATGESLPGVCVVRDVKQFQKLINTFQSMEEAKEKETPKTEVDKIQPPKKQTDA